jgi:hypothetical protein
VATRVREDARPVGIGWRALHLGCMNIHACLAVTVHAMPHLGAHGFDRVAKAMILVADQCSVSYLKES